MHLKNICRTEWKWTFLLRNEQETDWTERMRENEKKEKLKHWIVFNEY